MTPPILVTDYFRHEYARLVAGLAKRFGIRYIEDIEDAVQAALLTALNSWTTTQAPQNLGAWVYRVALNNLLAVLRRRAGEQRVLLCLESAQESLTDADRAVCGDASEDLLGMLFLCCDEAIPVESQIVFALRVLCGFDIREIAIRLFTSEANVSKRLGRARNQLRELAPDPYSLATAFHEAKLPTVLRTLYLLFTEGHLSSHPELAVRRDLCDDALRLTTLLAEHRVGQHSETFALMALMHFHLARMTARQSKSVTPQLLEEQDRSQWDGHGIQLGLTWLAKSAEGSRFSRYHAEAGIAAEHCLATSFQATRWNVVADLYAMLEQTAPSPLHTLNRAVAIAEWQGPAAGLAILAGLDPPTWLHDSYLWAAVLSDLHRRNGNLGTAARHRELAIATAPTQAIRDLLMRRLRIADG